MKKILFIFAFIALVSCAINNPLDTCPELSDEMQGNYDRQMMQLAKAVNAAVRENSSYRILIKQEVSKQLDGDYDYLFSTAMTQTLAPSAELMTRSGCYEDITVRELLSYYFEPSGIDTKSSLEYLDDILAEYPELQVSVPVHAEDWDPENYIPIVAFIPEDCEYPKTKTLPGIDAQGEMVEVDAINEPDEPVIVVGLSERINVDPSINIIQPVVNTPKITLSGRYEDSAIRLEYSKANIVKVNALTIYRTNANSNIYKDIASYSGLYLPVTYNDWAVEEGKEYSYYLEAECTISTTAGNTESTIYSNILTLKIDPSLPAPISNLHSVNEYSTKNFITWENPDTDNYLTQIFKTTPDITNSLIATLEPTETYYYDEPVVKGEKWTYLVKKYNPDTGEVSPHEKTFVYNPYRNPSGVSKVMLKKISLDRKQIEGWFEGRPEVYITTYGHLKLSNGDIKVDTLSQVTYQFPAGSNGTSDDLNLLLADWSFFDDSDYYPVINIHAVEYDRGNGYFDMSVDAKIGYKASDRITLEAKGHFEFRLNHDVQDCGIAYLRYYQNPDVTLDFSNYEFKLTLSE